MFRIASIGIVCRSGWLASSRCPPFGLWVADLPSGQCGARSPWVSRGLCTSHRRSTLLWLAHSVHVCLTPSATEANVKNEVCCTMREKCGTPRPLRSARSLIQTGSAPAGDTRDDDGWRAGACKCLWSTALFSGCATLFIRFSHFRAHHSSPSVLYVGNVSALS